MANIQPRSRRIDDCMRRLVRGQQPSECGGISGFNITPVSINRRKGREGTVTEAKI